MKQGQNEQVVEYFPDRLVVRGWISLWQDIFSELPAIKELAWRLFLRDFSAMYRQSMLGYFWAFFVPLLSVGLFVYLNRAGLFVVGDMGVPYPVYAIAGMAFWQLFGPGLSSCTNSLVSAGGMITKINFPRESLVFAALGMSLVSFALQLLLAVVLLVVFRISPPLTALLALPAAIPILVFTLAVGLVFAVLNGVVRDTGNAVPYLTMFLLFVTPVLYKRPANGLVRVVTDYNPLYYLITTPRDLLLFGEVSHPTGYVIATVVSFVLFMLAWQSFHLAEVRIAERI